MCGGGGGGGGVNNNRPVSRPPPLSIERPPSFFTPERPRIELNNEDTFEGRRAPRRAKPVERSVIDRLKETLPKIGDFIRDRIARDPVAETPPVQNNPAPVIPR